MLRSHESNDHDDDDADEAFLNTLDGAAQLYHSTTPTVIKEENGRRSVVPTAAAASTHPNTVDGGECGFNDNSNSNLGVIIGTSIAGTIITVGTILAFKYKDQIKGYFQSNANKNTNKDIR